MNYGGSGLFEVSVRSTGFFFVILIFKSESNWSIKIGGSMLHYILQEDGERVSDLQV